MHSDKNSLPPLFYVLSVLEYTQGDVNKHVVEDLAARGKLLSHEQQTNKEHTILTICLGDFFSEGPTPIASGES